MSLLVFALHGPADHFCPLYRTVWSEQQLRDVTFSLKGPLFNIQSRRKHVEMSAQYERIFHCSVNDDNIFN